jgi:hypothetical protein
LIPLLDTVELRLCEPWADLLDLLPSFLDVSDRLYHARNAIGEPKKQDMEEAIQLFGTGRTMHLQRLAEPFIQAAQ